MGKGKPSFEEALQRLEAIVESIEGGKVGLEDSIRQFEEGTRLIEQCRGILADAELKIQKLQAGPSGELEASPLSLPGGGAAESDGG